jgi:hypothetical protein
MLSAGRRIRLGKVTPRRSRLPVVTNNLPQTGHGSILCPADGEINSCVRATLESVPQVALRLDLLAVPTLRQDDYFFLDAIDTSMVEM